MAIITSIKQQVRTPGRFSVYLDGRYGFAMSGSEAALGGLHVGQELSAEEIQQYSDQAGLSKLYNQAVRFISLRPRSRREVEDYMHRKGHEAGRVEAVLLDLERVGLVNDLAFAESWVASRLALRPRSRRVLQQELTAKGVAGDTIAEALRDFDEESQLHALMQVAERKRRLSQYQAEDKLIAYLARQGYAYDLIKKALARLDE